jgi:signal transduction histidine kinase
MSLLEHHLNQKNYQELDKYLNAAMNNLDNISKFTQGLMDFSSLSSNFELCSITTLVSDVIDYLKTQKHFNQIEIRLNVPPVPLFSMADISQVQQLLYNMVNNSADAIREKGEGFRGLIEIEIRYHEGDNTFTIRIGDNGVGIEKEQLEIAFNKRFTTKKTGHGFGLLVCRRIIDNHGGHLSVDSTPGVGTVMTINFPVRLAVERPVPVT